MPPAETGPVRTGYRIRVRMTAREIDEPHRVSSQLELLFDLTFVVAVAAVTAELADHVTKGHGASGLVPFLQVFFALWWAWMNFTWFASSYDNDDAAYRVLTMVQMAGVLVLAAGVPAAAGHADYRTVLIGYLVMRAALFVQWVRAGVSDPPGRRTALRYASGIMVAQAGWVLWLLLGRADALPSWTGLPCFVLLALLELAVPRWAERAAPTNWHPHHIAERYGLFTIILFGESVLAAFNGVRGALDGGPVSRPLIVVAGAGLVLLFALWWLYFLVPVGDGLHERRDLSFVWGYGHYGIFASLSAIGAGLEAAVGQTGHDVAASPSAICYAVAIPTAVFVLLLWTVHAPLLPAPVIRPVVALSGIGGVLLLPLAAPRAGVVAVVVAIAVVCVLVTAATIVPRGAGRLRSGAREVVRDQRGA